MKRPCDYTEEEIRAEYMRDRFDDDRHEEEEDEEEGESLEELEEREYWRNVLNDELRRNR